MKKFGALCYCLKEKGPSLTGIGTILIAVVTLYVGKDLLDKISNQVDLIQNQTKNINTQTKKIIDLVTVIEPITNRIESKSDEIKDQGKSINNLNNSMNKQIEKIASLSTEINSQSNEIQESNEEIKSMINTLDKLIRNQIVNNALKSRSNLFSKDASLSAVKTFLKSEVNAELSSDNVNYFIPNNKLDSTAQQLINANSEAERALILKQSLEKKSN
ncbi:hypothetical protein L3V82_02905 [Thiotrichales bacterium 19S3-7]|nr:hypothetical protein [Thiotrichales bacterium 19S3-7]MCF6801118.1 hypothetical protein [Thiotrichales bacterium 19S3-11]